MTTTVASGGSGVAGQLVSQGSQPGLPGWALLTLDGTDSNEVAIALGGIGGSTWFGGGGRGGRTSLDSTAADSTTAAAAGSNGTGYGAGGGGAAALNDTAGAAGGNGVAGVVFVIEFG